MNVLVDTHIFLWYITADPRLLQPIRSGIENSTNRIYSSAVSVWEVMVKYQLGKLILPSDPAEYIPQQRERHRVEGLSLDEGSVGFLSRLPSIHRDPFDRMLLCQAMCHDLALATQDEVLFRYTVGVAETPWRCVRPESGQ